MIKWTYRINDFTSTTTPTCVNFTRGIRDGDYLSLEMYVDMMNKKIGGYMVNCEWANGGYSDVYRE